MAYDQAMKSPSAPKEATLNDRLNRLVSGVTNQCDRLESVLSRVNGTPAGQDQGRGSVAQISPTHSMTQCVDMLEQANQRLANLASGVEAIA